MFIYRHYKLHVHFDILWLVTLKSSGYLQEIGYAGFVDTVASPREAESFEVIVCLKESQIPSQCR